MSGNRVRTTLTAVAALALGLAGAVVIVPPASAAVETYPVTKSVDDGTANTLRWAIGQANAHANDPDTSDVITIDAGLAVTVNAALPALIEGVTVVGGFATSITRTANFDLLEIEPDATKPEQVYQFENITFQGFGTGRALNVDSVNPVESLTTNNCNFNGFSVTGDGGAVYVAGSATHGPVEFSVTNFSGNTATLNGGAASIVAAASFTIAGNGLGVGSASGNTGGSGGAISLFQLRGPITVLDMTFADNTALFDGGALSIRESAVAATINVTNSGFDNNNANRHGGGLHIDHIGPGATSALILNSTFTGNDVVIGAGAGVWMGPVADGANFTVRNSEFIGNTTQGGDGGGVYVETNDEVVEVDSSTFSNNNLYNPNDTDGRGNSIAIEQSSATVRVLNSTIDEPLTNNSAIYGTFTETGTPNLEILSSTIVSGNHGLEMDPNSPTSSITNTIFVSPPGGFNLIGSGPAWNVTHSLFSGPFDPLQIIAASTDRFGIADMKLGALAENGGPTQTRLPAQDSPAINFGTNAAAYLATTPDDQRGPGYPRILNGTIDAGAVEVFVPLPATGPVVPLWMPIVAALVLLLGAAAVAFSVARRRSVG